MQYAITQMWETKEVSEAWHFGWCYIIYNNPSVGNKRCLWNTTCGYTIRQIKHDHILIIEDHIQLFALSDCNTFVIIWWIHKLTKRFLSIWIKNTTFMEHIIGYKKRLEVHHGHQNIVSIVQSEQIFFHWFIPLLNI